MIMLKAKSISGKFTGCGSRSDFYVIDKTRGFKTFCNMYNAYYARDVQIILSCLNLAPNVLSEIGRIRVGGRLSEWGYITELAKILSCNHWTKPSLCPTCEKKCYRKYSKKISELAESIYNHTEYEFVDDHFGNVGFIVRDKKKILVCIDTGIESISNREGCNEYSYQY
jgi:hypothetical protein